MRSRLDPFNDTGAVDQAWRFVTEVLRRYNRSGKLLPPAAAPA
jgi:hypothetical protein